MDIKMAKRDIKDIYFVIKEFCLDAVLLNFLLNQRILGKKYYLELVGIGIFQKV